MKRKFIQNPISEEVSRYWLEWLVTESKNREFLETSSFRIVHELEREIKLNSRSVPLIWLKELEEWHDLDWLHILRTPSHKPRNPYELVSFIQELEQFLRQR